DCRFSFHNKRSLFLEIFQFSGFLFISRISSISGGYIVRFVVGFLLGPTAVTFYVVPWKLLIGVGGLLSSAAGVLFPYASEINALGDRMRIQKTFIETSKVYAAFSVPLHLVFVAFSKPILTIWMGSNFAEKDWLVLSLLAFSTLLGSLSTVPNLITMGLGYTRIIGFFSILTFISYVTFVPVFTKLWGIEGTAWGMLGSVAPGLALLVYETERIMQLRIWYYLKNVMQFHLIPIMASLAFIYFLQRMPAKMTVWILGLVPLLLALYFFMMARLGWIPLHKFTNKLGV
ncbi:MAG: oligosaccharide flippase family protein, partial [Candidatus Bathyarchaeia archaeon]